MCINPRGDLLGVVVIKARLFELLELIDQRGDLLHVFVGHVSNRINVANEFVQLFANSVVTLFRAVYVPVELWYCGREVRETRIRREHAPMFMIVASHLKHQSFTNHLRQ